MTPILPNKHLGTQQTSRHSATTTTMGRPRGDMTDSNLVRLGGIFGLLAVVARIPGLFVGYPDSPASPEEASSYFATEVSMFVLFNGVFVLFSIFFLVLFVGVLYRMLRRAEESAQRGGGLTAA